MLNKYAYFNNAATTYPKPEIVYSFMDQYYRTVGGNIGRGGCNDNIVNETRALIKELFHCPNKKVVLVASATEALNIVLQGLVIEDNFTIYISPFEHNSVMRVLNYLQSIYKLKIQELAVNKQDLQYDMEKIKYQFSDNKPNVVIVSHASNVCGVLAPIEEICRLSKKYNAINVIDMCQTAGLIDVDLSSNIYDFNIFAGHKTLYGPFGISGFVCNDSVTLRPLIYGGAGIDSANTTVPENIPERFELGSQNTVAIAGLNASLRWIKSLGTNEILTKELENTERLLDLLGRYENIKLIGSYDKSQRIGVVSCVFDEYSSDNIGLILKQQGVEVRTGLHCSPAAHKFLNTFPEGTVRFSIGYFNNDEDFNVLETALDYIEENS